jgi:hypothetical protein
MGYLNERSLNNMIKANELRVGNWVNDTRTVGDGNKANNKMQVQELRNREYQYFEGIPLTTEILEACGFVKFRTNKEMTLELKNDSESESINLTCYDRDSEINLFLEVSQRDANWVPQYTSSLLPIKFLHQLQNFYVDWTLKELAISGLEKKGKI